MKRRRERSVGMSVLNSFCAVLLVGSACFMFFAGLQLIAMGSFVVAALGIAVPVLIAAEGIGEMLSGFFEAVAEGFLAIFEAISSIFS